jgi:catechol 2,3-dioxygenase-like lactoylglutathione lyase family enzyme
MLRKTAVTLLLLLGPWGIAEAQLAVPNGNGLAYGHVHLNVSDVELHKRIWTDHFGGVVVERGSLTAIRLPNMLVALTPRAPTGGSLGTVMDHFGFKVRNMADWLARWRAAGYTVDSEFTGAEGQPNAYVTLPDGVRVEMQEDQSLAVEVAGYHIHFITPQYQELLAWYMDMFSTELRPRGRIATTTNVPGMNLSFGNSQEPTLPTQGRAIDHIGFELDDLEAFCNALLAKGVSFDIAYRDIPSIGLKIAFITDPSGVYIELTEGYDDF